VFTLASRVIDEHPSPPCRRVDGAAVRIAKDLSPGRSLPAAEVFTPLVLALNDAEVVCPGENREGPTNSAWWSWAAAVELGLLDGPEPAHHAS
jgi:hypothetical protein